MKTEDMKEELRAQWARLENKSAYAAKVAPLVGKSKYTIYRHWFSNSDMSPGLPSDKNVLKTLLREIKKAPKK